MNHLNKAFTIMEIMITVIIIGVIAAFAIPNYSRTVSQARLQDAIMQLSSIRSANQMYYSRTRTYWPPTNGKVLSEINSSLSLNIIANALTYNCDGDAATFTCTAVSASPGFTVTVTEAPLSATNPRCTSGACP